MIQPSLSPDLRGRWESMQAAMKKQGTNGCLLTIDVNLYYMTGRVFNGYFYLPIEGDPWFFVKRPQSFKGKNVVFLHKPEQLAELFSVNNIKMPKKLLLEADELSYTMYMRIFNALQPEEVENATLTIHRLREIKRPYEIEQLRYSALKHAETYHHIPECYKPGMTDIELQAEIELQMRKNGSYGIFHTFGMNMEIFMGSILVGDNALEPSPYDFALGGKGISASMPIGANGTPIREGNTIMVDMAGNYTPYTTDMTRVYAVGKISDEAYHAHQVSRDIEQQIMRIAKPGTACADLYNLSLEIATKEGLGHCFMGHHQQAKFVGHGIGIQINELPVLAPRSHEKLKANMVFALEPKFVIPGVGAVGIENSFLVTPTGLEKLTHFEEDIIQL